MPLSVAVTLGGFGEWLGATLLGYGVSDTIKKGVADTTDPDCWACGYCDSGMAVYAVGMLCALLAAALFLLLATFAAMPVSTTHAIVAGVVGMTMVGSAEMDGVACLNWAWSGGLTSIVASWAISPLFSGAVAFAIFRATKFAALDAARPGSAALLLSPFLYSTAAWVMTFLIMLKSQPTKQIERSTQALTACVVAGLTHAYASLLAPRVREAMPTVRALRAEQEQSHRAVRELSARLVRLEAAYRSLEQAHSARKPPSAGLLGALRERIGADDPAASPSPRCAPEPGAEVLEVRRSPSPPTPSPHPSPPRRRRPHAPPPPPAARRALSLAPLVTGWPTTERRIVPAGGAARALPRRLARLEARRHAARHGAAAAGDATGGDGRRGAAHERARRGGRRGRRGGSAAPPGERVEPSP